MNNKKILDLYNGLMKLSGLKGVKFNYAVAKNVGILEPEVKAFQKAIEPSQAYQKFDEVRAELAKKHAIKNEDKTPMFVDDAYVMEDQAAFDTAFEELKGKHKEVVEERENQIKEFNELMEKETYVTLFKVKYDQIPEEITTEQMKVVYPIIEE